MPSATAASDAHTLAGDAQEADAGRIDADRFEVAAARAVPDQVQREHLAPPLQGETALDPEDHAKPSRFQTIS